MTKQEHMTEEEPLMNAAGETAGRQEDKTTSGQVDEVTKENEDEKLGGKEENVSEEDEVTVLKRQYDELNDKYLRLYSEFDNFRKRTQKEKLELYKTAGEDIISAVLPVIDDFDRAAKAMKDQGDVEAVKQGIELIRQKFNNILHQKGLKPMESAIGKELDTNFHEAITRIPSPEEKLKGKVIDEVEKGYLLHDKVIRYAKVVVGE